MSTQTSALPDGTTLTKPAASERVSLSVINTNTDNIANNIIHVNGKSAIHLNVTGSSNDEFVSALATALNSHYNLANAEIGTTFTGDAEWAGVTYMSFVVTKIGSNACNIEAHNGAGRYIIGQITISNLSATGTIDFLTQVAIQQNKGTFSSASALSSILDSVLTSMPAGGVQVLEIDCSLSFDYFSASTRYMVTLYKSGTSNTFAHANFRTINTTDEIIGRRNANGWGFDKNAVNPMKWKDVRRNSVTQSNAGSNYFVMPDTFSAISGYSRRILQMYTNNNYVIVLRCNIAADGTVTVMTWNLSNSSQTFDIIGIYAYLPDKDMLT